MAALHGRSHSPIINSISAWYDIHPDYAVDILDKYLPNSNQDIASVPEFLEIHKESRIQLEYAFSTNVRGRDLLRSLQSNNFLKNVPAEENKSYLDIGCAYGGFLKEFHTLGYRVHGVEFDGDLSRICKKHMETLNIPANVINGDFLDNRLLDGTEIFDFITCNDVIEHVQDAEKCLTKIIRLLKPGGIAYIETVNKNSLVNNASDIHFGIFGLNLMDWSRAEQIYKQVTKSPVYFVSEFYSLNWYLNCIKKNWRCRCGGCICRQDI